RARRVVARVRGRAISAGTSRGVRHLSSLFADDRLDQGWKCGAGSGRSSGVAVNVVGAGARICSSAGEPAGHLSSGSSEKPKTNLDLSVRLSRNLWRGFTGVGGSIFACSGGERFTFQVDVTIDVGSNVRALGKLEFFARAGSGGRGLLECTDRSCL